MMTATIVDALRQSDVFGSLEESRLEGLAAGCRERSYGAGEMVFLRGDQGDCMYAVASGSVAVSLSSEGGRDVLLAVLGPPRTFGELAVVDRGPRVATVTARERTVLVVVPRLLVTDLIATCPSVATSLLLSMAGLVRRLDE